MGDSGMHGRANKKSTNLGSSRLKSPGPISIEDRYIVILERYRSRRSYFVRRIQKFSKEVAVELQNYRMDVKHLPDNGETDVWLEAGRFKDNWFPSILRRLRPTSLLWRLPVTTGRRC
jgi:hypothetical protein